MLRSLTNTNSAPAIDHFAAQSLTPRNRCVRFVADVAAGLTQHSLPGGLLGLTWAGLSPADRASFAGAFTYSITSSALAERLGGTSMPSALATLKLIVSLYLVAIWIGKSPGFSPARMRLT